MKKHLLSFALLLSLALSSFNVLADGPTVGDPGDEYLGHQAQAAAADAAAAIQTTGYLVGPYQVHLGPLWEDNPPTYTCLEACAEVYGGAPADYYCSTQRNSVNQMAWASTWGTAQHCDAPPGPGDNPVPEDFKLNDFYDCGDTGCSISAYVQDHCAVEFSGPGTSTNYCFAVEPPDPVPSLDIRGLAILAAVMLLLAGFGIRRWTA